MHKNRIELEGYLGQAPQLRALPSGTRVANARLAEESYRYRDAKGQAQVRTTWHTIVLYGALADLAETFRKGENIRIVGALLSRQFTPSDGSRARTVWEVVAQEAYVIAPPRRRTQEEGTPGQDAPVLDIDGEAPSKSQAASAMSHPLPQSLGLRGPDDRFF